VTRAHAPDGHTAPVAASIRQICVPPRALLGQQSPFLAVKRPAGPCKNALQNRLAMENVKGT
jgi:hypothetical protein